MMPGIFQHAKEIGGSVGGIEAPSFEQDEKSDDHGKIFNGKSKTTS